jgi:hypothetical protein
MSVVELLKHVKALPPREREKLFLAILALDEEAPAPSKAKTARVKLTEVDARSFRYSEK